jgi:hypothetical protein
MKLNSVKNHDRYVIEEEEDLFKLQIGLMDKKSDSKIKWVAQELANNIVEYQEKGSISVNGRLVVASIDKNTMSSKSIEIVKLAIKDIEDKDTTFNTEVGSKHNYKYGGLGFVSISKMGFKYKIMDFTNNLLIICKIKNKESNKC